MKICGVEYMNYYVSYVEECIQINIWTFYLSGTNPQYLKYKSVITFREIYVEDKLIYRV